MKGIRKSIINIIYSMSVLAPNNEIITQVLPKPTLNYSVQNFVLLWLVSDIDGSSQVHHDSIGQLRHIVNHVDIFTDCDKFVDFVTKMKDIKAFIIVSGSLGQNIVPKIHDMSCIQYIYVFDGNTSEHEQWAKEWSKVDGVFTDIQQICGSLKHHARQCDQDLIPMSFVSMNNVSSHQDLDQLEPSFMYSTLLKEILLELDYSEQAVKELTDDCRENYKDNDSQLKIIDQFEREYHDHTPIWWYTLEGFTYKMLNRALRTLAVNDIVKMGFFVRDIHQHITELHSKQTTEQQSSFIVYRGQGMTKSDFDKMTETQGGLISFNSFLSTSKNRAVSLAFVTDALKRPESVCVLFEITINPSVLSTPFAQIDNVSYYEGSEEEILFSMHSIFRIGEISRLENRVWQVELILTADTDPQLSILTKRIRREVAGSTGWHRLGKLLIKTGSFNKAEEVYRMLLKKTSIDDHKELSFLYNQLGSIKVSKAEYDDAIQYYEKSLEIKKEYLPSKDPDWGISYNSVGLMYNSMGEYTKALSWHQKALEIRRKFLAPNHLDLAQSYNNIGEVYHSMEHYSKAILSYEKALAIRQNSLPLNHPDLAESYNNIAEGYSKLKQYSNALLSHEKSLEILLKSLPPNHPHVAMSYDNIGSVYAKMEEFPKALSSHEKALEIFRQILSPSHPDVAMTHYNIAKVYNSIQQYSMANQHVEQAVEIVQEKLPENHHCIIEYRNLLEEIQDKIVTHF
jgi:tetratricopeptide (TPR) repeat protein